MPAHKTPNVYSTAIAANLGALAQHLTEAAELARQAQGTMERGRQSEAIGTVLALEKLLPEAQAFFKAALVLHLNRK